MHMYQLFRRPISTIQHRGFYHRRKLEDYLRTPIDNEPRHDKWEHNHYRLFAYNNTIGKFVAFLKKHQAYQPLVLPTKSIDCGKALMREITRASFPLVSDGNDTDHVDYCFAQTMRALRTPYSEEQKKLNPFVLYSFCLSSTMPITQLDFTSAPTELSKKIQTSLDQWLYHMLLVNPYLTDIIFADPTLLSPRNQSMLAANRLSLELLQVAQIPDIDAWIDLYYGLKVENKNHLLQGVRQKYIAEQSTTSSSRSGQAAQSRSSVADYFIKGLYLLCNPNAKQEELLDEIILPFLDDCGLFEEEKKLFEKDWAAWQSRRRILESEQYQAMVSHVRHYIVDRQFIATFVARKYNFNVVKENLVEQNVNSLDPNYYVKAKKYIDLMGAQSNTYFTGMANSLTVITEAEKTRLFERLSNLLLCNERPQCSLDEYVAEHINICNAVNVELEMFLNHMPVKSHEFEQTSPSTTRLS